LNVTKAMSQACAVSSHFHEGFEHLRDWEEAAAASVATGWNESVSGRKLYPLKSSAFDGALLGQLP
jgi:hypothetical protein